jgi:hypothetical protein
MNPLNGFTNASVDKKRHHEQVKNIQKLRKVF